MRAYVMSLARRPDRLAAFQDYWVHTRLRDCLDVEPFVAIDGTTLDVEALKPHIRPVNLSLPDQRLRGILGCALSHLGIWKRIAAQTEPMMVFEDDARLVPSANAQMVADALTRIPRDADFVWLNDSHYGTRANLRYRLSMVLRGHPPATVTFSAAPDLLLSAEAYVLSPAYARILVELNEHDLGAMDRHIQLCHQRTNAKVYQVHPPLFCQANLLDSDTGGPMVTPREAQLIGRMKRLYYD